MEQTPDSPRTPCCFCFSSAGNREDESRHGGMGRVEILSDASTFSVAEQDRRLKMAVKEEERLSREAESVVTWVKQESARMDVSSVHPLSSSVFLYLLCSMKGLQVEQRRNGVVHVISNLTSTCSSPIYRYKCPVSGKFSSLVYLLSFSRVMKQSKPWIPFTANCCSAEDQATFGNFSRCRPLRSEFSENMEPLASFRRISFSDLSRSSSMRINDDLVQSFGSDLYDFQLSELRAITHNFSSSFLLGEGGFGKVHKGYVDESLRKGLKAQAVAVKLLDIEGPQGHREWLAEVVFLGQLRHPNLVKLIGYCCQDEERLLVYEFMPRGSLENHLFKRISVSLPWSTRLKIAVGAAKGLAFLHGADKPVIYRDFKTSNILLDSDFSAKLSDFGLAKMGPEGSDTHVTTRVMGTLGYAAPEYVTTGHLTTKSDVYSFGVVLLELLTGRRALDRLRGKSEQNLIDWVKPYLSSSRHIHHITDPRLNGQYSVKGAKGVVLLARQCISLNPKDRPRMEATVETLECLLHFKDMAVTSGQWPASFNHPRHMTFRLIDQAAV